MEKFSEVLLRWPCDENKEIIRILGDFSELDTSKNYLRALERYVSEAKPFCVADAVPQDVGDPNCRRIDLIGGLPFTSEKFPWPKTPGGDLWMQPILQLDLQNAGALLGIELGSDILQVWGPVAENVKLLSTDIDDFVLRRISKKELLGVPSDLLPNWSECERTGEPLAYHYQPNETNNTYAAPGRKWGVVKPMYGARVHFINYAYNEKCLGLGDELDEWVDQLFDALGESPLIAENNSEYLGGHGGQKGAENDASYGEGLLLRLTDYDGFYFALHAVIDQDGNFNISKKFSFYI